MREEFIIQGLAQVQAYDGKTGWQISPFGGRKDPELLSQDDLKSLAVDADIDGPLVDYKEKGHKAELVGHDSMEGTDCFKIKLSMKNGDVRYYYLDADSFLELKLEIQTTIRGALQENELYFGDYEQVNRASERHLLCVCRRAGAEGQCFARADLGREDRTKYSAGRRTFLHAGVQTGDEGGPGWEVTIEKE